MVETYEKAFDAYLNREFDRAASMLEPQRHDGPSEVLFERCKRLQTKPPPPEWRGVHVATSK